MTRPAADSLDYTLERAAFFLRAQEVTALELTRLYLDRIEALNPRLHAFITVMADDALADAERATAELARGVDRGPLHGIPVSIKDVFPIDGYATTRGTRVGVSLAGRDAAIVKRLKDAGAIILGKTALPELGLGAFHPDFPVVRNPWDLGRSAEGSSVGSAAAVAARLSLASLASDAGGSIRRPAAHCGITGLKPTFGLLPTDGVSALAWSMEHIGPLTLSVVDCYLTLSALVSPEVASRLPGFAHPAHVAERWHRENALPRLGIVAQSLADNEEAEWDAAFHDVVEVFEDSGASVREVSVPSIAHAGLALITIMLVETVSAARSVLPESREGLGEEAAFWLDLGARVPGSLYVDAHRLRARLLQELREVFRDVDVLIGPATRGLPPKITPAEPPSADARADLTRQVRPTAPWNLSGLPALALPCGFSASGLPLGFQMTGQRWEDGVVLAAAWLYEQQTEWWKHIPPAACGQHVAQIDLNPEGGGT